METVGSLINKLKVQFEQNENSAELVGTIHQLLSIIAPSLPACNTKPAPNIHQAVMEGFLVREAEAGKPDAKNGEVHSLQDTFADIPTLAHQNYAPTLKTFVQPEYKKTAVIEKESLNDRLRQDTTEVAAALQGAPIRDLKKAIGVNDRFLFIQNLFRGDENMYERSLKTINGFSIYPEAQYWIQRELKVKLSWPDQSDTVRLFDQLVKRRFS